LSSTAETSITRKSSGKWDSPITGSAENKKLGRTLKECF
jgi:hypothetical protein